MAGSIALMRTATGIGVMSEVTGTSVPVLGQGALIMALGHALDT